jgi:4'-phosphopantetheinyl transferase
MLIAIRSPPTVLTLTADDVHVWHVDPARVSDPGLIRRYDALMSPDERARHARFVFPRDQHIYLVARALVRTTLSKYAGVEPQAWTFQAGAHGRPEIAGPPGVPPLRFSLSHTAGLVALAVTSRADVGIDVEGIDARASGLDIARRYFAPAEAEALEALPPEQQGRAFIEYWTLKESYIKATGLGLSMPLKSFAFRLIDPPVISFNGPPGGDPLNWHFYRLDLSGQHLSALAVRSARRPSLTVFDHSIAL